MLHTKIKIKHFNIIFHKNKLVITDFWEVLVNTRPNMRKHGDTYPYLHNNSIMSNTFLKFIESQKEVLIEIQSRS